MYILIITLILNLNNTFHVREITKTYPDKQTCQSIAFELEKQYQENKDKDKIPTVFICNKLEKGE